MLTGVAVMVQGPSHNFTGAWVFVVVVLLLIVLIFVRMYGGGGRSGRRSAHRSGRRTAHQSGRRTTGHNAGGVAERGGNHGHRAPSRRRAHRP